MRQRWNWRFVLIIVGLLLLLLGYTLPMFPRYIDSATTRYTGGTVLNKYFSVLVHDQTLALGDRPTKEEFESVQLHVIAVQGRPSSAWGWLSQVISPWNVLWQYLSFAVCLIWPLLSGLVLLWLVLRAWFGPLGLPERWIPAGINLSGLGVIALVLTWLHQFDFSTALFRVTDGQLWPAAGFWLALVGQVLLFVAALALKRETGRAVLTWWVLVFVIAFTLWSLTRFKPYPFQIIWNFVADGILVTLRIVVTSFGFILLVSLLGGLGRISKSKIIYGIASLYVELVRGIPLLVQLLFIWFALPQVFDVLGNTLSDLSPHLATVGQSLVDLRLSPFTAAVIGLTVCYGAYGSEIFRAGISSIHHGQMEAARSLGMNYLQAMRFIVLPQAVRVILPPVGNEFVALLKDSSLVSVLAVSDLTRRGREYMARTFQSFETWILVALCYLVLTLFSSRAVEFIESKTKSGR